MAALRLKLDAIPDGKEHKRQRSAVNKQLYAIENDASYIAAAADVRKSERARAVAADAAAWARTLQREQDEAVKKTAADAKKSNAPRNSESRLHFRSLVASLFDEYAPTFEAELVHGLRYQTPNKIRDALDSLDGARPAITPTLAVDLGCGTGLAGVALQSRCNGRLIGCDLSKRMLAIAAHKRRPSPADGSGAGGGDEYASVAGACDDAGATSSPARPPLYDELVASDVVACLHRSVPPASADLIVAADVLVYMDALEDLFEAVASAAAVLTQRVPLPALPTAPARSSDSRACSRLACASCARWRAGCAGDCALPGWPLRLLHRAGGAGRIRAERGGAGRVRVRVGRAAVGALRSRSGILAAPHAERRRGRRRRRR